MLAEKLREADQRAAAAESSAKSGKGEVQTLTQHLNAAEKDATRQKQAHRKTVQELETRIAELASHAAEQTPEKARLANSANASSPEGTVLVILRLLDQYVSIEYHLPITHARL